MANVFTRSNDATPKPNRNTFDGSFVNNLTLKMGQITPCFLKEVIPGDSFKIDAKFGFNFQPMVFPVQSDMQANLHFFYVRNRALWRGWQDFITKTQNFDGDSTPPFIKLTKSTRHMFETGQIGDYLGVPTVAYGNQTKIYNDYISSMPGFVFGNDYPGDPTTSAYFDMSLPLFMPSGLTFDNFTPQNLQDLSAVLVTNGLRSFQLPLSFRSRSSQYYPVMGGSLPRGIQMDIQRGAVYAQELANFAVINDLYTDSAINDYMFLNVYYDKDNNNQILGSYVNRIQFNYVDGSPVLLAPNSGVDVFTASPNVYAKQASALYSDITIQFPAQSYGHEIVHIVALLAPVAKSTFEDKTEVIVSGYNSFQVMSYADGIRNEYLDLSELPFASTENSEGLRISALPFRAVEACYNSFYRDDRNNPLIIGGTPYYNKYIRSDHGGADTREYKMYQRNWEQDVFTTAVQSPQQGIAPLVGVTAGGQMTFEDEEGKSYYLQATFGEDGHTITGIQSYSSDMPVGTLRAMVDTISTGISINDFRNVNALQRWLETNMRKGLRYKDQIEAHFGTTPTYSELDMPEFIGGMSRKVSMNKVVQTSSDVEGSPMGTLAGSASIFGEGGQPITHYADEHGWIIGFITISPKPVYSQNLNKQLLKTELLDYYFPEFAHIGYQPILNQEIAPLQCTNGEGKKLTDVFGYQRAWYEYLSSVDEVHGDFRTSMKDYLIHRVFDDVPQLGNDFLTISPDEANEVFANQNDDAKIFGLIEFDVKMKRPIPAIGVPKLEIG